MAERRFLPCPLLPAGVALRAVNPDPPSLSIAHAVTYAAPDVAFTLERATQPRDGLALLDRALRAGWRWLREGQAPTPLADLQGLAERPTLELLELAARLHDELFALGQGHLAAPIWVNLVELDARQAIVNILAAELEQRRRDGAGAAP